MGQSRVFWSFICIAQKMRREVLLGALLVGLAASAKLPEVSSYAKVSKNGEESKGSQDGPLTWLISTFLPNATKTENSEARSAQDISITVSPVYVPPRIPGLQRGEAVDYPSTKKYSTLDEEMVARLDGVPGRQQAQDRFHPPAAFEHVIAHSNAMKLHAASDSGSAGSSSSSDSSSSSASGSSSSAGTGSGYSQPVFPGYYDYKPPDFVDVKPMSGAPPQPMPMDSMPDPPPDSIPKAVDPPGPPADFYGTVPDFGSGPVYGGEVPPKSVEYGGHYDHPAFVDDPYIHDHDYPHDHDYHHDHEYHHDIIYDHIPDDHTTATMPPEMMDQRLSKRPYSYYFIGKKLWYLPLYFSIYFIIYIGALVLKSIARHKINFPASLAAAAASSGSSRSATQNDGPGWWELTGKVLEGIEAARKKYGSTD